MKLSIIIPAYNEEKRIGNTLESYGMFFEKKKKLKEIKNFEILVVINNTTDKTEEIVKRFSRKFREIRHLNFKQAGKGFAIIEGFKDVLKKDFDLIGFVDADMSTSPEAFYDLIKNINGYDGIIASRAKKGAKARMTLVRKITHRSFNFVARSLFLLPYEDTQCGSKIFTRKVVEKITPELSVTEWAFDVNLLYSCKKHNFKIKEYPTVWENKRGSKITDILRTSIQMFSGLVRLRLLNSFFEPILRPAKFILRAGNKILRK